MPTVIVDGKEVEIGEKERLNGIQVAARAGVEIPHYCWHAGLSVVASCRMCLVESGKRDAATGKITIVPKLVPACQTPATPDTVFVTNSPNVLNARAMVEEDLLLRHPVDCSICDKAGECKLQDYHFEHGRDERRADIQPFHSRRRDLGETITLFVDRCVMCTRCVRFTREITGTRELFVENRGSHEEINVFPGYPLDNKMSGNVSDLCPVGALGDKDFLYSQRVWFMKSHDNVCAGCSTGCSIRVDENQDHIYRLKPRENAHVNQWWMCDDGRYGWKHVHDRNRIVGPRRKDGSGFANVEWSALPAELDKKLKTAGRLAAVISPHLTVEEAYLFAKYICGIDANALLILGHVPVEGEDEKFPNGFVIRAEKCPNRRGVMQVISSFTNQVTSWDELVAGKVDLSGIQAMWITGGYKGDWNDDKVVARLSSVPLLIVQDLFESPLMNAATYQLPAAAFAEREGSYVNFADRLQSFPWAVRAPAGVKVEGSLFWQLSGMTGLFNARKVLDEVASEIGYFHAAAEAIPETGVDLKVNQLANATPVAAQV